MSETFQPADPVAAPELGQVEAAKGQPAERAPSRPEQAAKPSPVLPAVSSHPVDNSAAGAQASSLDPVKAPSTAVSNGNPQIADDIDVIEKEWVQKAKKIVDETREDPKRQKDMLSEFKADYMKKRYNKDIKIEK